ncbi:hypothetical protein [Corynebacterium heidelbergense]|uniref:Uncharacterized protein n=1 Tax=Corynebacterium heidelbergense TaxID=2055947 RepID=A0A364VDP7_9CORY|nr:hypothetical protein [Corynebacterium heidelbergense]RAV34767.1 hypothetical protein CWC39_01605 [Corynebacterium heidelbergense]WCZ37032.1 hypothetical protein CHEID_07495 [Corynebacterium heidelbergense]
MARRVETAVRRMAAVQKEREAAVQRERELRAQLVTAVGEAVVSAVEKPRSRWAAFRTKPLDDLLVEIGLVQGHREDTTITDSDGQGGPEAASPGGAHPQESATEDR